MTDGLSVYDQLPAAGYDHRAHVITTGGEIARLELDHVHLVISLLMATLTISITLRLFGKLTPSMHLGRELQKGNIAVGLLLSSVVIVSTFYVAAGLSSLSKALVPQPSIGRIEIQK